MAKKYDPVWDALKSQGKVELAVPIPLHKKVMRGIINCKDRDLGFKLQAGEDKYRYIISYESESAKITVLLNKYPAVEDLSVNDL